MREAGKGDTMRPTDYEKFATNFEKIFGKRTSVTEDEFKNANKAFEDAYIKHKENQNESK